MVLYEIILGIASIIGLVLGAELVIHNARDIAHRLKISDFFIGLTVFSIGTSLPEIATHVIASIDILRGLDYETLSGLAVGTNIGSNIIQITFITGLVAFFGKLKARKAFLKVDYIVMLGSIVLLFIFSLNRVISRLEGAVLFTLYIFYIIYLIKNEKLTKKLIKESLEQPNHASLYKNIVIMVGGLVILLLSADKIAELATFVSARYMISGSLLGTLIVGISTALPEFTTSIFALRKKNSGMSLGTLVGSNITNPMMALGLGAVISSYSVDSPILLYDLPFWFGISFILLIMMWLSKNHTLTKKGGAFLILSYIAFVMARLYFF